jgi:hypothetical protein
MLFVDTTLLLPGDYISIASFGKIAFPLRNHSYIANIKSSSVYPWFVCIEIVCKN